MPDNDKQMPEFGEELTVTFENVRAEYVTLFDQLRMMQGLDPNEAFEKVIKAYAEQKWGVENTNRALQDLENYGIPDLSC